MPSSGVYEDRALMYMKYINKQIFEKKRKENVPVLKPFPEERNPLKERPAWLQSETKLKLSTKDNKLQINNPHARKHVQNILNK